MVETLLVLILFVVVVLLIFALVNIAEAKEILGSALSRINYLEKRTKFMQTRLWATEDLVQVLSAKKFGTSRPYPKKNRNKSNATTK